MKRVVKRTVAFALFVLLTFGGAGAVAFAQPDELMAGNTDLTGQSDDVPASFDLRDVDGVSYGTSVKNQRPFNTCWGFAATSAAETSILGQGLVYEGINASNFDLSEKQLAYFAHTHINDPTSSQDGEGMYTEEDTYILITVISKYEEPHLRELIAHHDEHAFMIISDNIRVVGNFQKRFTD